MAETKLVGQNYETPDIRAKVTGRARYSEDFRAPGMLFARLLLSPYSHAKIRSIDTSAALAMPGVKAILLPEEVPGPKDQVNDMGQTLRANPYSERALATEPLYQGEPVLAVARSTKRLPPKRSRRSKSDGTSCRSTSIRSPRCDRAPRPRASKATCGCDPRRRPASRRRFRRSRI